MKDTRFFHALTVVAGVLLLSAQSATANDVLPGSLAECASIADDTERLACFDAVASAHSTRPPAAPAAPAQPATPEPPAPASAAPAAAGPTPITDEVGRERVEGGRDEEPPEYSATVTRCEENQQSGQTYFYFENGQVWKQANYRRLRFRECRFDITLTEDNFGYVIYIPSKDRRVRVTRIR